jgi:hypothetical protein
LRKKAPGSNELRGAGFSVSLVGRERLKHQPML